VVTFDGSKDCRSINPKKNRIMLRSQSLKTWSQSPRLYGCIIDILKYISNLMRLQFETYYLTDLYNAAYVTLSFVIRIKK
jgi:hypothetical protein